MNPVGTAALSAALTELVKRVASSAVRGLDGCNKRPSAAAMERARTTFVNPAPSEMPTAPRDNIELRTSSLTLACGNENDVGASGCTGVVQVVSLNGMRSSGQNSKLERSKFQPRVPLHIYRSTRRIQDMNVDDNRYTCKQF
jgi:hypothetical protein